MINNTKENKKSPISVISRKKDKKSLVTETNSKQEEAQNEELKLTDSSITKIVSDKSEDVKPEKEITNKENILNIIEPLDIATIIADFKKYIKTKDINKCIEIINDMNKQDLLNIDFLKCIAEIDDYAFRVVLEDTVKEKIIELGSLKSNFNKIYKETCKDVAKKKSSLIVLDVKNNNIMDYRKPFLRNTTTINPNYEYRVGKIVEQNNKYFIVVPEKKEGKETGGITFKELTNFTFTPIRTIEDEEGKKTEFDLNLSEGKIYKNTSIQNKCFAMLSDLRKELKKIDINLSFQGDIDDILKFIIDPKLPEIKGTHKTGLIDNLYVTYDGTYNKELKKINDKLIYSDTNTYIKNDLIKAKELTKEEVKIIGDSILNYNEPEKCISILSWCTSCFIKMKLADMKLYIPILSLIGEHGSGKSTTADSIIKPIFSTQDSISAMNITKFSLTKNSHSSNLVPLVVEEYKPNMMSNYQINVLSDFLRNTYNNTVSQRGQKDQSVQSFSLTAPVLLVGENITGENALTDRIISLDFHRKQLEDNKYKDNINLLISNEKLLNNLGYSILKYVMNLDLKRKEVEDKITQLMVKIKIKDHRIKKSIAILGFSYELIYNLFKENNFILDYNPNEALQKIDNMVIDRLQGTEGKSELEQTIELIDSMADIGYLKENFHYAIDIKEGNVYLHTGRIFTLIGKYIREYNIKNVNILTENKFQERLKEQEQKYYIEHKQKRLIINLDEPKKTDSKKCYVIDLIKLNDKDITQLNLNKLKIFPDNEE